MLTPALREWRSFQNQGRTDGLRLSHWVKAGTPHDAGTKTSISLSEDTCLKVRQSTPLQSTTYRMPCISIPWTNIQDSSPVCVTVLKSRMLELKRHKLTCEDKDWTKEETDYLFDLVRQFDQRFYIVADRYEFPGGPPRTMEVSGCKDDRSPVPILRSFPRI